MLHEPRKTVPTPKSSLPMLKRRNRYRKTIREGGNKTTWISRRGRGCSATLACGSHPCRNSKKTSCFIAHWKVLFSTPVCPPYTDGFLGMKRRGFLWESNLGTGFIVPSKITWSRCFWNDSFCRKACDKSSLLILDILRWWKVAVLIYVRQVSHWEGSAQLLLCLQREGVHGDLW